MPFYFAYGSNMLAARLRARCPSARAIGTAEVAGFDIAFDKIGQDGSGKATLLMAAGQVVQGALFQLDEAELATLDQIEGVGRGYDRVEIDVNCSSGSIGAATYLAPNAHRRSDIQPFDWYIGLVVAGAHERGLPRDWIRRLADTPALADPDARRPRLIEAQALLAACPPGWRLG